MVPAAALADAPHWKLGNVLTVHEGFEASDGTGLADGPAHRPRPDRGRLPPPQLPVRVLVRPPLLQLPARPRRHERGALRPRRGVRRARAVPGPGPDGTGGRRLRRAAAADQGSARRRRGAPAHAGSGAEALPVHGRRTRRPRAAQRAAGRPRHRSPGPPGGAGRDARRRPGTGDAEPARAVPGGRRRRRGARGRDSAGQAARAAAVAGRCCSLSASRWRCSRSRRRSASGSRWAWPTRWARPRSWTARRSRSPAPPVGAGRPRSPVRPSRRCSRRGAR